MMNPIVFASLLAILGSSASAQPRTQLCEETHLRDVLMRLTKDCPNQTLSLKIGYNPGGNTYALATHFMAFLKRTAGDGGFNVTLEARAGASGEIASRIVSELEAKSAACSLLVAQSNQLTTNQIGVPNAVDPNVDLVPVAPLGEAPLVLAVNPKTAPYSSMDDFIRYMKDAAGSSRKDFFGSNGNYATDHVATERLLSALRVSGTHVPFTGSAPLILNLLATTDGQVNFALLSLGLIKEHLVNGSLVGLGIAAPKDLVLSRPGRADLIIPSISRFVSGYTEASIWVALAGGRNMPSRVSEPVQQLAACFAEDPQVRSVLVDQMAFKLGGDRNQMLERMREETEMAHSVYRK